MSHWVSYSLLFCIGDYMRNNKDSNFKSELNELKIKVRDLEQQLRFKTDKNNIQRNIPIILTGIYGYMFDTCLAQLFEKWQIAVICVLASIPFLYMFIFRR